LHLTPHLYFLIFLIDERREEPEPEKKSEQIEKHH